MAAVEKAKQLAIQAKNRVGLLAGLTGMLKGAGINVEAICCYCMEGSAYFMMVVDQNAAAKKLLQKAGYDVAEDSVIRLELSNKPGTLNQATEKIAAAGVDIDYLWATATARSSLVVLKTRDDAKALRALRK